MLINGTKNADNLVGNLGETDQFYINNVGDVITNSEGRDVILSSIDIDMSISNSQWLVLMGRKDLSATGTSRAEVIGGNSGNNVLNGGAGQDRLIGGLGADMFVFDSFGMSNSDIVEDYNQAQGDLLALSSAAFGVPVGTVVSFVEGSPVGASPTVFRDQTNQLWFDPDGSGSSGALMFAQFRGNLSSTSFTVI